MTAFLVLCMAVIVLAAHLFLTRQRQRAAARARGAVRFVEALPSALPAADQRFHRGHTWVQRHDERLASVGVSSLAANFIGEIAAIEAPAEGSKVGVGERAVTLVAKNGRRLSLPVPVGGKVLAVNDELVRDPALVQRRPYDKGWVLRVKPEKLERAVAELAPVAVAQQWFDSARAALTARLSPVPATVAFDGGEWVPAFGERLDDEEWSELKRELFAPRAPASVGSESELGG
jgi:glycine cleavage system H protein